MTGINILLIEDNKGDILLIKEALIEKKITNTVEVITNGADAIRRLTTDIESSNKHVPDLIILDINLPKKNGFQVLNTIKDHEATKKIPVIMLTTSSSSKDINLAYESYVNCFITKPVDVDDFLDAVTEIEQFWLKIVTLPND